MELIEKAGGAGAVCIPAAPDSFAIALAIVDDEGFHGIGVELEVAGALQFLDGLEEDEVGGARAEAGGIRGGEDEELAGLEMGGADEGDGGDARGAILAAEGHVGDLAEDGGVAIRGPGNPRSRDCEQECQAESAKECHGGIVASFRRGATGECGAGTSSQSNLYP